MWRVGGEREKGGVEVGAKRRPECGFTLLIIVVSAILHSANNCNYLFFM